jgi:multiple sugar transport system permease protein
VRKSAQAPLWVVVLLAVMGAIAAAVWTWQSTRPARPDGRREIVLWGGTDLGVDIWTVLRDFELEHPQYKVTLSNAVARDFTGDAQRLMCAIAGGVPPDVVRFDRFAIGEWAGRGSLEDLTPWLEAQDKSDPLFLDLRDYYPFTLDEASYRPPGSSEPKRLFGIPTNVDARFMVCNADHLRQQGFYDPTTRQPRVPRTWDELRHYATALTRHDDRGRLTRLGFAPNFGNSWLYLYAFQAGGDMLSEDGTRATMTSPPVVRALRYMTDVYDDLGGAKKVNGFQSSFQGGALDPFLSGRVSIKIDGDWSLQHIADWRRDMDFIAAPAPMPADRLAAGAAPVTWSGGFTLIIPSTSREKEGAFRLIQYLRNRRVLRRLQDSSRELKESEGKLFLPTGDCDRVFNEDSIRRVVEENPLMPATFRQAYSVIRQMLPNTKTRTPSPIGQLVWNQHVRAFDAAVNHRFAERARGDKDEEVRLSLATMQEDVERELARVLSPPPPRRVSWPAYFVGYGLLLIVPLAAMYVAYRRRRREYAYKPREIGAAMLFASPWLIGMAILTGGPILFSVVLSFTRYDVLNEARYVGAQNYREVLADPVFYQSLWNTAYMVIRIPLTMALSLAIALLLNRSIRGIGAYRTGFYMPAIMPLVASSLLWIYVLNPNLGLVNNILGWLIDTPPARWIESVGGFRFTLPAWLQDARWSKPSLILVALWSAGGGMIIWLAGLQSIPQQLYEAATVDGAGKWRQFRHVTLPMLSPYILFNVIIGLIGTMQIFHEAFIMTAGGPDDSTLFYAYYLFRQAFQYFRMGYASALAWVLFAIVLALTLFQLWLSKRWVHYERS